MSSVGGQAQARSRSARRAGVEPILAEGRNLFIPRQATGPPAHFPGRFFLRCEEFGHRRVEGRLIVLIIDEPEPHLFAVNDLVVIILPEQGHRRLPGHELGEDLAITLVVLRAVAAARLPRQAKLADEDPLRREASLGGELGVDVVQRGPDLFPGSS